MFPYRGWVKPFQEQDDRLGFYGKLEYTSRDGSFHSALFYYDNQADKTAFEGVNYGWDTQFWNLSIDYQVGNGLRFLWQAMTGATVMGAADVVDTRFDATYLLATYNLNAHRFSARYDIFQVDDEDETIGPKASNDASEGWAATFAYLYALDENQTLALEFLRLYTEREGNDGLGSGDPDDNLLQIMYRFTFGS